METEYEPVINNWYQNQESDLHFNIIDIDETKGVLDIQHADGDLDTMDFDIWYESGLELATEPENWFIGLDNVNDDADDNLVSIDASRNRQKSSTSLNRLSSVDNQRSDTELQPDAIDEQALLQEWEEEEAIANTS